MPFLRTLRQHTGGYRLRAIGGQHTANQDITIEPNFVTSANMKKKYSTPDVETASVEHRSFLTASAITIKPGGDLGGDELTDGGETKDDTEYNPW